MRKPQVRERWTDTDSVKRENALGVVQVVENERGYVTYVVPGKPAQGLRSMAETDFVRWFSPIEGGGIHAVCNIIRNMSDIKLVQALQNVGTSIDCGGCMSVLLTGYLCGSHTCGKKEK